MLQIRKLIDAIKKNDARFLSRKAHIMVKQAFCIEKLINQNKMKTKIQTHQKLRSVGRLLENHPQIFVNKKDAETDRIQLNQMLDEASGIISNLLKPISFVHGPKQEQQKIFEIKVIKFIGMGMILADHLKNSSLQDLLETYRKRIRVVSSYKKFEIANHLKDEIVKYQEIANSYGLTAEKIEEFSQLTESFKETLEVTDTNLFERRVSHKELKKLLRESNQIVKMRIDPLASFLEYSHPAFYDEYMLLRGRRSRRKKKTLSQQLGVEILGTVTKAGTTETISGAVITIISHELVTKTDIDGYYLFDELPAAAFVISCHYQGYMLPEQVVVTASADESLVVNFVLTPVVAAEPSV